MHKTVLPAFTRRFFRASALLAALVPMAAQALVGTMEGSYAVSKGAATYSIPIQVAPGVAGMQPSLSLEYSSDAGNGLLGVGWSLGGLSSIHRCGKNLADDGDNHAVNYTSADRFCMDGQRLVAVDGAYGGNGTQYRTQIDSHAKIVSYGSQGSGPQTWKVWTKSGQTMEFGVSQDARVELQGGQTVSRWLLNKVTDAVGVEMNVTYQENNAIGSTFPLRIDYSDRSVRFEFDSRPDSSSGYDKGFEFTLNRRLSKIVNYVGNSLVLEYRLAYEQSPLSGRSRIINVTQCAQGDCLPPTYFDWQGQEAFQNFATSHSSSFGGNAGSSKLGLVFSLDLNADGESDLVKADTSNGQIYTYLSTPNDGFVLFSTTGGPGGNSAGHIQFADVTGDGYPDLIKTDNNGWVYTYVSNGNGHFQNALTQGGGGGNGPGHVQFGDINGDGKADLVKTTNTGHVYTYLSNGNGTYGNAQTTAGSGGNGVGFVQMADVNSDGNDDLIKSDDNGNVWILLSTGNQAFHSPIQSSAPGGHGAYKIQFADLNGDGTLDMVKTKPNVDQGFYVYIGYGTGHFSSNGLYFEGPSDATKGSSFIDLNADGIPELLQKTTNSTFYVRWGQGDGTFSSTGPVINGNAGRGDGTIMFADVNGDAMPDMIRTDGDTGGYVYLNQNLVSELITDIEDGNGNHIETKYESLATYSGYDTGDSIGYPYLNPRMTTYVVAKSSADNGIGSRNQTTYRYGGLRLHLEGRGSLGFAWTESKNEQTGDTGYIEYRQDFPFTGSPKRTEQRLGNGTLIGLAEMEYAAPSHYTATVYNLQTTSSTETSYDNNGALISTVTTTNSNVDAYGNVGTIVVTTFGGGETYTKTTTSTYGNDLGEWHLGRLTRAVVQHEHADGSIQTRTSGFTYSGSNGLLLSETIEPDDINLWQTTTYTYDGYGNKTSATVTGANVPARTSSTGYSSDGLFPTHTINALGHREDYSYDANCGKKSSLTGPNGLTTTWDYDLLCRVSAEHRADGTSTTYSRSYEDGYPTWAAFSFTTQTSGQSPVTVFYDALDREVRKQTIGFDGRLVFQDTQYNALGQVSGKSLPYFDGSPAYWIGTTYDNMGRPNRVSQPVPGGATGYTYFSYNGLAITETNTKGISKTTTKNVLDKTKRVDESEGAWVTYRYDAIGNLVETNAMGAHTLLTYDQRGNKIAMDDPDMGIWSYQYDALGNLISQTDAKGQTVTLQYDLLGRKIQRNEAEGITIWTYDTAGKGIGKLAEVDGPNGYKESYSYDSLGRPQGTSTEVKTYGKVFDSNGASSEGVIATDTFDQSTEYDAYGRVSRVIRPQGFELINHYNDQGYLESIKAPAEQISDYDILTLQTNWTLIELHLEQKHQEAQALADGYAAQAAVYRAQAQEKWQIIELLGETAPNMKPMEDHRLDSIEAIQASATDLDQMAAGLEAKAAEAQNLANAILAFMPASYQTSWFQAARARYDSLAQSAFNKIEAAFQQYLIDKPTGWVPIQVGGITTFVRANLGFVGVDAITNAEQQRLNTNALWERGNAELYSALAAEVRLQKQARDKLNAAIAAQPDFVWVPIRVGDITTFIEAVPAPITPENTLTQEEQYAYYAQDFGQADTLALIEYFRGQVAYHQEQEQIILRASVPSVEESALISEVLIAYQDIIDGVYQPQPEITFWRATMRDAAGRLTAFISGNGLETHRNYDQATGQLEHIYSGFAGQTTLRDLEYTYDSQNNVSSRIDHVQGISESFQYDALDRLTRSEVSGQFGDTPYNHMVDYQYDALGNMISKSDVGSYQYNQPHQDRPHALASVTRADRVDHYEYDANGNMTYGGGREIEWSSFNKPVRFENDFSTTTFEYGPDRARFMKNHEGKTTLYIGKTYERIDDASLFYKDKHYIYADGQLVAIHIEERLENDGCGVHEASGLPYCIDTAYPTPDKTRYLHRDALGSIDTITDGQGQVVERSSFDPFGQRRAGDWRTDGQPILTTFTNRGFTGHEHVAEMGLIHMNGRVYDPELGRFLSADPHVQAPHNSQSYNRYSYVLNNPLKYTDPSGYFFKSFFRSVKKVVKSIVKAPAKVYQAANDIKNKAFRAIAKVPVPNTIAQIAACYYGGPVGCAAYSSQMTYAQTGSLSASLKAAAISYGSAVAFNAVGTYFPGTVENAIAHGVIGGVRAELQGGKFASGFVSGAFGSIGTPSTNQGFQIGNLVRSTVAGGVGAVLGGGKFENGATTAAFGYIFNSASHPAKGTNPVYTGFSNEQAHRVYEYFFKEAPSVMTTDRIVYAEYLLNSAFESSQTFGFIGKVGAMMGPAGLHATSIPDIILNISMDLSTGGGSSWVHLFTKSSLENPIVYDAVRYEIARKQRSIYEFEYSGRYR